MTARHRSLLTLVLLVLTVSAATQWWAGHRERDLGREAAVLAAPGDIEMLASETCGICALARMWMTRHEVRFAECLVERDAACKARFDALGAPGTPVLLVRGRPQLGFDPERVVAALRRG